MTELATGRVRVAAATGPEIGATATVDLLVRESDCASALHLSNATLNHSAGCVVRLP